MLASLILDINHKFGTEARIQLNDKFSEISDIPAFIYSERESKREELRPFLTTALKVDKETNMGIVGDIKQELRKVNALKINYTTRIGDVSLNKIFLDFFSKSSYRNI